MSAGRHDAETSSPGRRLRDALASSRPLLLPGLHDALSARQAERAGFGVGYLSGSATAMALLGLPDIGLLTATEIIEQARRVVAASGLALVCDGDTGFGNAVNVAHTVRAMEAAGVAGIQLEDQTFPKRCGHFEGKSVADADEMIGKIVTAVETRRDDDFVVIARTDARAVVSLDEAVSRAVRYRAAGADVLFVEAPQSVDELREIRAAVDGPLLVNVVEGGRTPQLELADYAELGYEIVLYPTGAVRTVAHALDSFYTHLAATGSSVGAPVGMVAFAERNEITGFAGYEELADRAGAAAGRYQPSGVA